MPQIVPRVKLLFSVMDAARTPSCAVVVADPMMEKIA